VHDRGQWELGDLALECETTYGGGELQSLAAAVGIPHDTFRDYRRVAEAFPPGERSPDLSWAHHRVVCGQPNRRELLTRARTEGWSVARLRRESRAPSDEAMGLLAIGAEVRRTVIRAFAELIDYEAGKAPPQLWFQAVDAFFDYTAILDLMAQSSTAPHAAQRSLLDAEVYDEWRAHTEAALRGALDHDGSVRIMRETAQFLDALDGRNRRIEVELLAGEGLAAHPLPEVIPELARRALVKAAQRLGVAP
jgi:hypothetical protein